MKKKAFLSIVGILFALTSIAQTITSLGASPLTVPCGGTSTLSWATLDCTGAEIAIGSYVTAVPITGTLVTPALYSSVWCELNVFNATGSSSSYILLTVSTTYDTVYWVAVGSYELAESISYPFAKRDTNLLANGNLLVITDTGTVTVTVIDTIQYVDSITGLVSQCSGDTVTESYPIHNDTTNGPTTFDTVHHYGFIEVPTAVIDAQAGGLKVYPNPATDQVHVFYGGSGDWYVRLYNHLGLLVRNQLVRSAKEAVIERGELPSGAYLLSIESNEQEVYKGKVLFQ